MKSLMDPTSSFASTFFLPPSLGLSFSFSLSFLFTSNLHFLKVLIYMKAWVAGQLLFQYKESLFSVFFMINMCMNVNICERLHMEYGLTYRYTPLELSLTFHTVLIYI